MGLSVFVRGNVAEKNTLQESDMYHCWGGLGEFNLVFKSLFGKTWTEFFIPNWDGCNPKSLPVTSEDRKRLTENLVVLQGYIDAPLNKWEDVNRVRQECTDMVALIELALSTPDATINFF